MRFQTWSPVSDPSPQELAIVVDEVRVERQMLVSMVALADAVASSVEASDRIEPGGRRGTESPQGEGPPPSGLGTPPFNADPGIVTFLERGTKPDPKDTGDRGVRSGGHP
jgi:hypothetical protein